MQDVFEILLGVYLLFIIAAFTFPQIAFTGTEGIIDIRPAILFILLFGIAVLIAIGLLVMAIYKRKTIELLTFLIGVIPSFISLIIVFVFLIPII